METSRGPTDFRTTRWSVVLAAGAADGERSRAALEELARRYWYPLFVALRRRGLDADEARDLVQGLFALLLARGDLARAAPERGRFRAYLLTALRHHAADERARERAAKRGGGRSLLELDASEADARYAAEPASEGDTPELAFERAWARTVLARALDRVRDDYRARGEAEAFTALESHLVPGEAEEPYTAVALRLGRSEGAVKQAVHRLRRRFRRALQDEIADTVADPQDVEDEVRHLFAVLSS